MLIHEAAVIFDQRQGAAISRKKWLEKGVVVRRISLDNVRHEFRDIAFDNGEFYAQTWRPLMEDIMADDWFKMYPAPKDSKVRWILRGLL